MVSEPIEFFGPKSMAEEQQPLIGLQKKLQEKKHTRNLRRLKYSCEEVYERMDNGLCIFCDELDTPGHHDLKHKGIQIFMVDCDDEVSEDKEEAHQETVKNPEPFIETKTNVEPETMKKYDPFIEPLKDDSALQVVGSVSDVLLVHKVDSHVKEVEKLPQKSTSGTGENVAHQLFDQKPVRVTNKEKHTKHLKGWKFKFKGKNLSRVMPQIGQYKFMERKRKRYNKFSSNIQIEPMRTRFSWQHWRAGKRQRISSFQLRYDTRSYIDVFLPIWLRYETQEKQHIGLSRAERVWKPGELVFLQKQWDWRSKVHNCGIIVNIARRLYGDSIITMSAKFRETYEEPQFELMCLKQPHDSVENYLGSFEYALTRSSLQHMPTNQYRAPFNPYQSYNDQPLDNTRHNNLSNEMAASLGLVSGDDQEDDTKFARKKIVKKNNSETKIEFSSSDHSRFVTLVTTSNLHKDTLSLPKDFTTSNGVKRECREIVLTDKGDSALSLELRFNRVGNGEILVLSLCPAEKASKESFPVKVRHWINQMTEAGYSPNEKIVYTLTSGLCQAKRDHEAIRVLKKLIQLEFSLNLLDCSSLTGLFCEPKLEVEVTVLLEWNMNIKRTTFFGGNVVKWKCWLVMGSRLPLHNWVALRKLIVWEVLCLLQNDVHRLLQSFSELKQRIIVSLWKSLGYLMEAHGSKYEGLVCVLERKKLRNIEDDINHLKRLLATMEGLAQKISCGLLCGDGKFHLKHKWKSRLTQALSGLQFGVDNIVLITSPIKVANLVLGLEVFVENVVLLTGPDKLLFSNNHKLLHPETRFCTQYNDLELLNTEHQSSPAGHINSRIVSVGGVPGLEAQCKWLLVVNEIPLLNNDNKGDICRLLWASTHAIILEDKDVLKNGVL